MIVREAEWSFPKGHTDGSNPSVATMVATPNLKVPGSNPETLQWNSHYHGVRGCWAEGPQLLTMRLILEETPDSTHC